MSAGCPDFKEAFLDWMADANIIKAGVDTLRSTLALFKDVQGVLPKGEKSDAIALSLVTAERQLRLADAEIAKGFGYKFCKCQAPIPTAMPLVGHYADYFDNRHEVYECPACNSVTAPVGTWERLTGQIETVEAPSGRPASSQPRPPVQTEYF